MVVKEQVGEERQLKPILCFSDYHKDLIMNKTNAETIGRILGTKQTDNWVGQRINLVTERVYAFGEMHDAVRVAPYTAEPVQA